MTYLYRVFDAEKQLLYIGITENLKDRFNGHSHQSGWFNAADSLAVEWYESRGLALKAESRAIRAELPPWNREGLPRRKDAEQMSAARPPADMTVLTNDEWATFLQQCEMPGHRQRRLIRTAQHHRPRDAA